MVRLIPGLLLAGIVVTYGLMRWQRPGAAPAEATAKVPSTEPGANEPKAVSPRAAEAPGAAATKGAAETEGTATSLKGATIIKIDPLIANLDEGDQIRYLKLTLQLEVTAEAQQRIQAALPRVRHEALLYMAGLHLSDVQGLVGKQRVHRELQRRIADALGGGLRRIYFDEFVVQ
ncbi:MAG: flagellar basal body-associated FliL family protein [Myxococcales bacterium]|nr:flagellar basal body-associated FliL family protein [Myxococcota bacterium]MDW8283363.1 flagellar basal body-associated FliL family protein [Myxococcales bacterium]